MLGYETVCYGSSVLQSSEIAPQRIRPLRRLEYERLVALGAFEDDHVELIHGNLVTMAPNDPEHASLIEILTTILVREVGDRASVRVQLPIIAADESEPEPDLAVVPRQDYSQRHPDTAEWIIEVAASSLKKDRDVKALLYAASGFAQYWIVNVPERCVEVFRTPTGGMYADVSRHGQEATLSPLALADIQVPVAALFA